MRTDSALISRSNLAPLPTFDRPTYLMCSPQFYDVDYVINPWMAGNVHRPQRDRAFQQWRALSEALHRLADVRVVHAQPGCPDMTFVAHAAVVQHGLAALSSFAHTERRAEEEHLRRWFEDHGFLIWQTPRETAFEGEGDALFDETGRRLWVAHGVRTSQQSHTHLASAWHVPVLPLHLVDPRFYHLDTCFAPLHGGMLLYYPAAFDSRSQQLINSIYPPDRRIAVTEAEATRFACNVINLGRHVLMGRVGSNLAARVRAAGFSVEELDLSEFLCGGGAAKALALRLSDSTLAA